MPAGARIGGYVVERPIGMGGMAHVYAAAHEFMGVRVALKVLHSQFRGRADILEKMRAEAQLLRTLDHPNLVRVTDAGLTQDGTVWMVMDLLSGETLRAKLGRGRLPLHTIMSYARQAVAGLNAAHRSGVIHRDVKPENIFITDNGEVKLLDFGTAKFRDVAKTALDADRFATLAYAAPETLSGGVVDARADMYSLGIVLHEALTGSHFLRRSDGTFPSLGDLVMHQMSTEPRMDGIAASVAAVLRRATAKLPAERYRDMAEVMVALAAATLSTEAGSTPSMTRSHADTPVETPIHSIKGVRVSTVGVLAVLVAALSAAGTFTLERHQKSGSEDASFPIAANGTSLVESGTDAPRVPTTVEPVPTVEVSSTTSAAPLTTPPAPSTSMPVQARSPSPNNVALPAPAKATQAAPSTTKREFERFGAPHHF